MSKNIEKFYNQNNINKYFIKNVSNNEQKNDNNYNKNLSQTINFNYKYSIIINNNNDNNNNEKNINDNHYSEQLHNKYDIKYYKNENKQNFNINKSQTFNNFIKNNKIINNKNNI